jgi:hypothetical protein
LKQRIELTTLRQECLIRFLDMSRKTTEDFVKREHVLFHVLRKGLG